MRHHDNKRKFGREKNQRHALLRTLAYSLVKNEKITTTEAKAKEIRPFVEKLVTISRTDSIPNKRLVLRRTSSATLVKKLFTEIGPRYKERKGGYTRITKLPQKRSDAAKMAIIEFVK